MTYADTTTFSNYVLLLPEFREHGYTTIHTPSLYYIIDSEWKELDQDMQLKITTSPRCCYSAKNDL